MPEVFNMSQPEITREIQNSGTTMILEVERYKGRHYYSGVDRDSVLYNNSIQHIINFLTVFHPIDHKLLDSVPSNRSYTS